MAVRCVLFITLLVCATWNSVYSHKTKLVIDNDAGGDDAMAIFIALLYEKHFNGPELIALTTANGNCAEDLVYRNNQRILSVAQRKDVPIYRGATESLLYAPERNNYYGDDGLGDTGDEYDNDLEHLDQARKKHAVIKLIELSKKYKHNLQVITIGALTNIALAIKLDPMFLDRIGKLYVGAGHIQSVIPDAEFNAKMDAEAYEIVVRAAIPNKVTLLPFSQVKQHLNISKEWRENVLGAINTDIMEAQNKFERVSLQKDDTWHDLDPALVAVALKPDLIKEYRYSNNSIELCGASRGLNINTFGEKDANVKIIYSIKLEEYKQFLLSVFARNDKSDKNEKE